eukprot:6190911-Pleurochrysis_carterae.AAC.2
MWRLPGGCAAASPRCARLHGSAAVTPGGHCYPYVFVRIFTLHICTRYANNAVDARPVFQFEVAAC